MAGLGWGVVAHGRDEARLQSVLNGLTGTGHRPWLGDLAELAEAADKVAALPVLDAVIHSAGVLDLLPARFLNQSKLLQTLLPNLVYPLTLTATLVRKKRLPPGSTVLFLSSLVTERGGVGYAAYAASKGALNAATPILAEELKRAGVSVLTLAPGYVDTPMTARVGQSGFLPGDAMPTALSADCVAEKIMSLLTQPGNHPSGRIIRLPENQ
jgi:NAD(P)-dependent dehydrogenase (short-subunit alcohol dehydrogenase family)